VADKIVELLRAKKLQDRAICAAKEAYQNAVAIYRASQEDEEFMREYGVTDWTEAWWNHGYQGFALAHVFEEGVLAKLEKPHRIVLEELVNEFIELCGVDPDYIDDVDFSLIFAAFVDRVNNHLLMYRQSDGFPVCRLPESADEDRQFRSMLRGAALVWKQLSPEMNPEGLLDKLDREEQNLLWDRNGVRLCVLGSVFPSTEKGSCLYGLQGGPSLHAVVRGPMTLAALEAVRRELERVVPSVLRSVGFLEAKADEHTRRLEHPVLIGLPQIAEPSLQNRTPFLAACLDAYYTDATKKDSMDRRIRNAVHLLVESDVQSSDAIGLSLSMSAIEALLGEHTQELTEKLGLNVAVLLEPDPTKRQMAVNCVKELYVHRSKALHGERLDSEPDIRAQARHLVAAVLDQVVSRRDFRRKGGWEAETPAQLLNELREQRFMPGQQGIEETNARGLWEHPRGGRG